MCKTKVFVKTCVLLVFASASSSLSLPSPPSCRPHKHRSGLNYLRGKVPWCVAAGACTAPPPPPVSCGYPASGYPRVHIVPIGLGAAAGVAHKLQHISLLLWMTARGPG